MHEIRLEDESFKGSWPVVRRFEHALDLPEDLRRVVVLLDACEMQVHNVTWCKYIKGVGMAWPKYKDGKVTGSFGYYIGYSWD